MMEKSTNDDDANWNDNYDTDISNFDDNGEQNEQKNIIIRFLTEWYFKGYDFVKKVPKIWARVRPPPPPLFRAMPENDVFLYFDAYYVFTVTVVGPLQDRRLW